MRSKEAKLHTAGATSAMSVPLRPILDNDARKMAVPGSGCRAREIPARRKLAPNYKLQDKY